MKIKVLGNHSQPGSGAYEWRPDFVFTDDPTCADSYRYHVALEDAWLHVKLSLGII